METIKVNMSPNPLDVQTIHASQNDGEARQWEFELHNNGELIDTSEITEQLFFKSYKGGTEQLLPENTSTPTTSPFKGDIRYPQGLLNDQEFTYRQSPTESDGLAKITDIKGNTLVWNQLASFASNLIPSASNGITYSYTDGTSVKISGTATANENRTGWFGLNDYTNLPKSKANHKVLMFPRLLSGSLNGTFVMFSPNFTVPLNTGGIGILQLDGSDNIRVGFTITNGTVCNDAIITIIYIDLTAMFGTGNEPTTADEFTSLFPYYSYESGKLLSFNGTGIKTVGFNQWDEQWEDGDINITTGQNQAGSSYWRSTNYIPVLPNKQYYVYVKDSTASTSIRVRLYGSDKQYIGSTINGNYVVPNVVFTVPNDVYFIRFSPSKSIYPTGSQFCINISSSKNGTYEPYTENTTNLPTLTYFPNGMKSAGSVYDELTPSKAITRIGAVDLGTLNWTYESSVPRFYSTEIRDLIKKPVSNGAEANAISSMYVNITLDKLYASEKKNMTMAFSIAGTLSIINTSYTSASAFKTAMSGVYLYYELATPTETSFSTASLVTENAEIPLSNEDGTLIGKCTEELSAEPGFHDAKIKLSDADGECYSNKLQLHVERKPS